MNLPTPTEIEKLHKKYAPDHEALNSVWEHCNIVRDISLQIANNHHLANLELLEAGALIHDIGVYKLYNDGLIDESRYVTHGLLGYELLKDEGFDEALCRFTLLHTGVGITKEDVENRKLPMPPRDYIAETDEERIVMYADKFHSKITPPTFNSASWYTDYLASKFGEDKVRLFEGLIEEFGEPDLVTLIARYEQPLRQ